MRDTISDLGWDLSRLPPPRFVARRLKDPHDENGGIRFESAPDFETLVQRVKSRNKSDIKPKPSRPRPSAQSQVDKEST